jgi:putative hydrolase of the HAD superfamily
MSWILIDIGNVLWCDDAGDAFTLANIARSLGARALLPGEAALAAAQARAVDERAPSAWRRVIREFCANEEQVLAIESEVRGQWLELDPVRYRTWTTPFIDSAALLDGLVADGHRLLLASNNEQRALDRLEELDLLRYFSQREVSDTLGLAKPDPRFFRAIIVAAGADPLDCLMVGDRLGNDIAPAKALGMKTLRLRVGSHVAQEPRVESEAPDRTVTDPAALLEAARDLLDT